MKGLSSPMPSAATWPGAAANAISAPASTSLGARDAARLEAARRRELGGKWIIAAGVEEQQLYVRAGGAHHLVDIEHAESIERQIALVVDPRGNRQDVIVIPHLDSVAGIVEQGDVRPGNILGEAAQGLLHAALFDVFDFGNGKVQAA